jgi:hypothetical protein
MARRLVRRRRPAWRSGRSFVHGQVHSAMDWHSPSSPLDSFVQLTLATQSTRGRNVAFGNGSCGAEVNKRWLKELETYKAFPPMQSPESYNLTPGPRSTFALQPVSLQGSVAVNIVLGVSSLKLRAGNEGSIGIFPA